FLVLSTNPLSTLSLHDALPICQLPAVRGNSEDTMLNDSVFDQAVGAEHLDISEWRGFPAVVDVFVRRPGPYGLYSGIPDQRRMMRRMVHYRSEERRVGKACKTRRVA